MKILYFADIRFPLERANGIQTMETCHALARRGHFVTLVVRPDTARPARDPFVYYGLDPEPRLAIAPCRVRGSRTLRRIGYLAAALARTVRGRRQDVVLTRDLSVARLLLRLPRGARPPVVYESHGFAPEVGRVLPKLIDGAAGASRTKQRRLAERERIVWSSAEGYVTITAALLEELAGRFGSRARTAVIPDGVRLAADRRFAPLARHDPPVVVYAGHLYPWKGVDVLLASLAQLADVVAVIVGGHAAEPDLRRARQVAADFGVADRVVFTGHIPPREVPALLDRADVLVLPNTPTAVSDRYTSPLKLFEYLGAGKPIVASNLPSLREVLADRENAVLVEAGDVDALADGIRAVLDDETLANRIARQAFDMAERYSWGRRAECYERFLQTVIVAVPVETAA